MDEKEYLRTKEKIKRYKQVAFALLIVGVLGGVSFVVGMWVWLLVRILNPEFLIAIILSLIALFGGCYPGIWLDNKARDLEIELEAYDKEREGRKAQQRIMAGKYQ